MCSHVAVLCETGPSSQNSAVCLHSIGLVLRFTHATTPYTCNYPLHMQLPPTHATTPYTCNYPLHMQLPPTHATTPYTCNYPLHMQLPPYTCNYPLHMQLYTCNYPLHMQLHPLHMQLPPTHATTPYTCNSPYTCNYPPTHATTPYTCMHFIPSCGDLTIKVLMRITVTNYTVLSLIQSPDSLELMGYACMHACTEGKQNSRMCNTITVALTLLHRTARGRDRGRVQGTGEANDCGMCTHTLPLHHITYNAQSEQRVHAFCNKVDHCSQYIHPQNPDYVVPMEPSLLFHKGTL